jgi:membrane protein required for colicin V production
LIIIISSFIYSIYKGFVNEVFSLLSIAFASIVATRYFYLGTIYLKGIIENKNFAFTIGFIFLFLITIILVRLLGMAMNSFIKKAGLSKPNRLLGGGLGIVKGVILVSLILLIMITFSPNSARTISETRWAHYLLPVSELIGDFLPYGLMVDSRRAYRHINSLVEKTRNGNYDVIKEDKRKLQEILRENL